VIFDPVSDTWHDLIMQSGFRVPYTVKETPDKGRGVFAEAPVNKGDILWRFVPG
jgi:SET domain-containing protein